MLKKVYALGLLSFATLGFASLPIQAQNAVNTSGQTANQAVVINGDRNRVKLRIIQVNTTSGQYPTDSFSKQKVNQTTVINGDGNRVDMRVRQVNAYRGHNSNKFNRSNHSDRDQQRNRDRYNNGNHNGHSNRDRDRRDRD